MTKPEAVSAAEPGLWQQRLAVLKAGLDAGKPGSLKAVRSAIAGLDSEMSGFVNRREIALGAGREALAASLDTVIAEKATHVDDLRKMIKGLKRIELAQDTGCTPEAAMKASTRDSVLSLELSGAITPEQAMAARMIARINEAISRAGQAKIAKLEGGSGGGGSYREPDMPPELDDLRHAVYIPWAEHLKAHGFVSLDIAVKVSVYGIALDRIRRRHHIGYDKALGKLRDALDLFNKLMRDNRRDRGDATEA